MTSVPAEGDRTPTWAVSARMYNALIVRIDKWLDSDWATHDQRQALAQHILTHNEKSEGTTS